MPAIPTNASAAPKPTLMEADFEGLNLNSGENHNADKEHTLGVQGAHQKRKRYRDKGRRSRKGKEAAVEDVSSNTADEVTEAGNVSEAEPEGEDHAPTSYSLSDTETVATEPLPRFRPLPQLPTGSFIQVPILARYELRDSSHDTDGEDDIDQGLFATQNIEQGTRIISERPLFTLPAPGDQLSELMEAHNNLSKPEQNRVWNLRPAAPEASDQLRNLRFLTDRLASDLQNIFLKPEGTRTNKEKATLQKMQPKLENAANVWRIAARWHANRCAMTDLPEDQRSGLPKGTPITRLFIERAQIRHSCVPNCFASYDPNFGRMNVHVTRDIATGEELTLSAFADNMYYKDAEDRGKELAAWGLTCDCEACAEGDAKFEMHQAARQRAHTRVVMLLDYLTRLEKEEFSEVWMDVAYISVCKLTHTPGRAARRSRPRSSHYPRPQGHRLRERRDCSLAQRAR